MIGVLVVLQKFILVINLALNKGIYMSLTEKILIDKIEILENSCIQVRQANIIEKDGIEVARSYHRWSLVPGQNLEGQEQKIKDIANLIWTPEVIESYINSLNKSDSSI